MKNLTSSRTTGMLSLLASCMAAAWIPASAAEKPNVLFIAVDDLVPTLGCYGDTTALTPQIDSLASQGMTFLNHHCQWAVCGPSRASMTTSLMPEETNVIGFKPIRAVLPDVITLPQHFKNQGYETCGTGKFYDPRTVGTITDPNGPTEKDTDDLPSWSLPYVEADSGFNPSGKPAVDDSDLPDSDYADHKILTEGLALIDTMAAGTKPFFLAVGFKKPHLPFVAPKRFWDLYDRNSMPLAAFTALPVNATPYNNTTLTDNDELLGYEPYSTSGLPTESQQRELIHGYYACTSMVDEFVGQLRAKLAATADPLQAGKNLAETTIIVLWGDHGFHLGDHGRWAKHTAMERGSKCPLIIYDPRNPTTPGTNKTNSPVNSMDIYPTLCELAGLPIPEQPLSDTVTTGRPIRGRSLVPVLENPADSVHFGAVTQFNVSGQYGYAYRTERFRLIEWVNSSNNIAGRDLYDYQIDPLETRNLADDPAYAAIVYQLSRSLRAETTIRGTGRLNLSSPMATGGDAYLPFVSISTSGSDVTLDWPSSGGVSYNVLASETLGAGSWGADFSSVAGPSATFARSTDRRFFRVGFGSGVPPVWTADPIVKGDAISGGVYAGSLASNASDSGDTLVFSKLGGPSWLSVAPNGDLSGTPGAPDAGANYFTVQVTDSSGLSARAKLEITVADPASNNPPAFLSDPIVKASAFVGASYAGSLAADAEDPDVGQTLTYSLVSASGWLSVGPDGTLSGIPGPGDVGTNSFTVQVEDSLGATDQAELQIEVSAALPPGIELADQQDVSGNSNLFGTVYFSGISVQTGDLLVVAHSNNKNTSSNSITLTGLGANVVQDVNSGSSGTQSSAWVFSSAITVPGTFDLTIDTSNATKTVSQATSLFVLRPTNDGTLAIASSTSNVAALPGVTTLDLGFTMSPTVTDAFGIAAATTNAASFDSGPSGWTMESNGNDKRRTYSNAAITGTSHTATFTSATDTDMALAGIVVKVTP